MSCLVALLSFVVEIRPVKFLQQTLQGLYFATVLVTHSVQTVLVCMLIQELGGGGTAFHGWFV
jgi:hypothetical protein